MSKRMNIAGFLSVAALALTLASSPAAAQCAIGSEPLSDPFAPYEEPGAIVHKDSGFVFPATVAGFRRQCEMTTDFSGNNFEIGYLRDFEDHEIEIKIAIIHLEQLNAGRPDIAAYQGIFDGDSDGVPWHFSVTALDYGYWDARLTASYPQEIDTAAQEAIMELITAFQWQTPTGGKTEKAAP